MKPQSLFVQVLSFVALLLVVLAAAKTGCAQSVSPKTSTKVVEFSGELRIDREVTLTVAHLSARLEHCVWGHFH